MSLSSVSAGTLSSATNDQPNQIAVVCQHTAGLRFDGRELPGTPTDVAALVGQPGVDTDSAADDRV